MLPVAGRPFVYWQLAWLAAQGADGAVLSIGHLGAQIRDYVGDGAAWRLPVTFVEEGDDLRGTGGAVRLAVDEGVMGDSFFVLYGDSYLQVALPVVEAAFRRGAPTRPHDGLQEQWEMGRQQRCVQE